MSKRPSTDARLAPACPCGSARSYPDCCAPIHGGDTVAATAEALMRSRYSAFVLNLPDYLLNSWHASTRPEALELDEPVKWLGLQILGGTAGTVTDEAGTVEFVARYKIGGKAFRLQENSRFLKEEGGWYYVDGELDQT